MFDKNSIKQSFSQASKSYEEYATLQEEVGEDVVKNCNNLTPGKKILDIGSGTGKVARKLSALYPETHFFCMDIAHGMSALNRKISHVHQNISVVTGDLSYMPFRPKSIDGAISNLCLQWADNLHLFFNNLKHIMKDDGGFFFTLLGEENFPELRSAHNRCYKKIDQQVMLNHYPPTKSIENALQKSYIKTYHLTHSLQERFYSSSLHFLKSLSFIGAKNPFPYNNQPGRVKALKSMLSYYDSHFATSQGVQATYHIVTISGRI